MQLTEEENIAPPLKTQLTLKMKNYEEPQHDLEMGLPALDDNPEKQDNDLALGFEALKSGQQEKAEDVQKPEVSVKRGSIELAHAFLFHVDLTNI